MLFFSKMLVLVMQFKNITHHNMTAAEDGPGGRFSSTSTAKLHQICSLNQLLWSTREGGGGGDHNTHFKKPPLAELIRKRPPGK